MAAVPGPSSRINFQPIELDPKPEMITAGFKLDTINQIQNCILLANKFVFAYLITRPDTYNFRCNYPKCFANVQVYAGSSCTIYIQTNGHKCGGNFSTSNIWKSFPPGTKVIKMLMKIPLANIPGVIPYLWVHDNIYRYARTIHGIDEFECCGCDKVIRLYDWTNPFTKRRVKLAQELYTRNASDNEFCPSPHQHSSRYDPSMKLRNKDSTLLDIELEDYTSYTAGVEDGSLDSKWGRVSTSRTRKKYDILRKRLGADYGVSNENINMELVGYEPLDIIDITKTRNEQLIFAQVASELDAILVGLPPANLISNTDLIQPQANFSESELKATNAIRYAIRKHYQLDPSKPIMAQKYKFMSDFEKYRDKQLIASEFPSLFRKTPKCSIPGLECDVWWDFNLNTICFISYTEKLKLCVHESGCDIALAITDEYEDGFCVQHIPNPIKVAVTLVIQILNPDIQNRIFSTVFSFTSSRTHGVEDAALDYFFSNIFTQNQTRKYLDLNLKEVQFRCLTLNVKKFEDEAEFQKYYSSQQMLKYIESQLQYSVPNQTSTKKVIFLPSQISTIGLDSLVLGVALKENSFYIYLEKEEELKIKLNQQFQDDNSGAAEAKEKTEIYLKNLKTTSSIDCHHKDAYAYNPALKTYLSEMNLCFGMCEFSTTHPKFYIYKIEIEYDDTIDGILFHFIATYIALNEVANSSTIEAACHLTEVDHTGFGICVQSLRRKGIVYTKTVKLLAIAYNKNDGYELVALYQMSHVIASLRLDAANIQTQQQLNPTAQSNAPVPNQSNAIEQPPESDQASTLVPVRISPPEQLKALEPNSQLDQAPGKVPAIQQTKRIFLNRKMKTLELNSNTVLRMKWIIRKEYYLELIESGFKQKYPTVEDSILSKHFNSAIFDEIDVTSAPLDGLLTQLMVDRVLDQCHSTKPTTVSNCNGISVRLQSWKSIFFGDLTITKEVIDGFLNLIELKGKVENRGIYLYPTTINQYLAESEIDKFCVMAKLEYANVNVFEGETLLFPFFNNSNKSVCLVSVFPRAKKITGFGPIVETEELVKRVKDYLEFEDARLMAAPDMAHSPRDIQYWETEFEEFTEICRDATDSDSGILCLINALQSFRGRMDGFILAGADIKYWRIYLAYILLEPRTFQ